MRAASSPLTPAPGQDQVERVALPDQSGQADRAPVDERHAPAPAVHAEGGVSGRDPQVAPQRELEPAGHGDGLRRRRSPACDSSMRVTPSGPSAGGRSTRLPAPVATALRSAPAQKVPPAPVRTAAASRSSRVEVPEGLRQRDGGGPSTALRASGRSIVTTRTGALGADADGHDVSPPRCLPARGCQALSPSTGRPGSRTGRPDAVAGRCAGP